MARLGSRTQVVERGVEAPDRNDAAEAADVTDTTSAPPEGQPAATGPFGERTGASARPRPSAPPARAPSGRLGMAAVCVVLVSAWAGVVPFVGPTFSYSADGAPSWYWNLLHAAVWLAPAALSFVAALAVLVALPRARRGRGRFGAGLAGLVAVVCGAWLVIGPVAWPVIERSAGVFVPADPLRELAYLAGWSLGPGVALAALGGFFVAWALRGRSVART